MNGLHLAPSQKNPATHVLSMVKISFMLYRCHLLICASIRGHITYHGILKRVIGYLALDVLDSRWKLSYQAV